MTSLSAFGLSIVNFFSMLWTSFVGLLVFKEKPVVPSQDIESGITLIDTHKQPATENVLDIGRDHELSVLPMDGPVGVQATTHYDPPNRRPSRRASAVDPVKSRIVEATLKQIQDKTIDVLKTVVLLPPVIAIPCSAQIEYYDPRVDDSDVRFGTTKYKPRAEPRAAQFVLPPIIVEEVVSDNETESSSHRKRSSSLGDLFDLFPLPPTHIPQPPPAVLRRISEKRRGNVPVPVPVWSRTLPDVADDSGDYSEEESVGSAYSSASFSDATADTSLPSSPASINKPIIPFKPQVENDSLSSPLHSPHSPMLTFAANGALDVLQVAVNDDIFPTTPTIQDPGQDFFPSLGLVDRSHNVVDGSKRADLQKGDIVDETCLVSKKPVQIQDMLVTSPSEDVIVDSLLAQLETSFELDKRESILRSKSRDAFYTGQIYPESSPQSLIQNSVAPLRIVKKNPSPARNAPESDLNEITSSWEESLDKVLQAFKEVEIEDSDFHDLFYRDSSFFSRSSLAHDSHRSSKAVAPTMMRSVTCERRSGQQLDDSFESGDKSIEEFLPTLDFLSNTITAVVAREDTLVNSESLPSVAAGLKDMTASTPYPIQGIQCDPRKAGHGRGMDPYTWTPQDRDDSEDQEDYSETEGEADQWSDHFELSAYAD